MQAHYTVGVWPHAWNLQVACVRLPVLGSNASYGDVQGPDARDWLEEDYIFESLRAIGANFDRDRSAFSPYGRAFLRLNSRRELDDRAGGVSGATGTTTTFTSAVATGEERSGNC